MVDANTVRAARERLFNLLISESEEREAFFSELTDGERRALMYRFVKAPSEARVDMNRVSQPPFPEPRMTKLLDSALEKYILFISIGPMLADEEKGEQA